MPLQKKFDQYPYFDDYNESKDYYKVLFKPGVAIQARELNQLQTMLQKQIERFGDHLFKSGTVVSGINFRYLPSFPYVKILDNDVDGRPVTPSTYRGLQVRNSANVVALVVETKDGFESKNPDLNTLYLRYLNSGTTFTAQTFNQNDILTVYSPLYPITGITINNGGSGFSNTNDVVITGAVGVRLSNTSQRFSNGENAFQGSTVRLEVIEAIDIGNNTSSFQVLRIKPRNSDLATSTSNSSLWTPLVSQAITGVTSGATATVERQYGSGARGIATTDSTGVIRVITVAQGGQSYLYAPHVTMFPKNNTADLSNLSLDGRNYKAKVTVGASPAFANAVGTGYAFAVSEGVIYQKGYFSRVTPQLTIVSKYNSVPDQLVVGFTTDESNVGVTFDSSLYDNAANTTNFRAPGADRLRLTPTLKVVTKSASEANTTFFPLVEFNEGQPSREYRDTQYNIIGREFERRTSETSGDFVIDPFFVTTKEIAGNTTHFSAIIDPGTAYINGKRVNTINNAYVAVPKVNTTVTRQNTLLTAGYGSYIIVKELRGFLDSRALGTLELYEVAAGALTNPSGTTAAPGTQVGTARIRALIHDNGIAGNPDTTYRLYLFDIRMNNGKYFENVRSLRFGGSNPGICDVVQTEQTTSGSFVTQLIDPDFSDAVFNVGINGVKTVSNVKYRYRTSTEGATIGATNGSMTLVAPSGAKFPYTSGTVLNSDQVLDFNIVPLATANAAANLAGTFSVTSTSANITTTVSQTSAITAGDYVGLFSATGVYNIRRVLSVNSSVMVLNSNVGFTNTTANAVIVFPQNVPINYNKSGRVIRTQSGTGGEATIVANLNINLASSIQAVASYNITPDLAVRVAKTVNRNVLVKISTSNNVAGNTGPWCLGIPDVIRLRNVYEGTTTAGTNVTREFFINDGGTGDFYGLSYLVKRSGSTYSTDTKQLLVELDCFTPSSGLEGFYTVNSYPINDTANLASSSATINTLEIPELFTARGKYYDLRDTFDFRPVASNTAILTTTAASATINPSATFTLNSDEKFFPVPGSDITCDSEIFQARADTVIVRQEGDFEVLEGDARDVASERTAPRPEAGSMLLNRLIIPRYPALPQVLSAQTLTFIDKKLTNGPGFASVRPRRFAITTILDNAASVAAQPRGYNMKRIGTLERRIEALESFAIMNVRENAVRNLSIPSSIDPTKQRFKNGFFVDGFDQDTSADFYNSEFNAAVEPQSSALIPNYFIRNLPLKFNLANTATQDGTVLGSTLVLPFIEEEVVSFVVGTVPYVPPAPSATPAATPSPSVSVAPPAVSASPSPTPLPSLTPNASASPAPSVSPPAISPSAPPSPSPSASPNATPPPSPSLSASPSPSPTPSRSAASSPSPTPSISASAAPSLSPTPTLSIAASIVTPIESGGGGDLFLQQTYQGSVIEQGLSTTVSPFTYISPTITTTTTVTTLPEDPLNIVGPSIGGGVTEPAQGPVTTTTPTEPVQDPLEIVGPSIGGGVEQPVITEPGSGTNQPAGSLTDTFVPDTRDDSWGSDTGTISSGSDWEGGDWGGYGSSTIGAVLDLGDFNSNESIETSGR